MITTCNTGADVYRRTKALQADADAAEMPRRQDHDGSFGHDDDDTTCRSFPRDDHDASTDACAYIGITCESDDDVTSEAQSSSSSSTALGTFREDLNFDEQIAMYHSDKWASQAEYSEKMLKAGEMSHSSRRVGLNILVNEAHMLQQKKERSPRSSTVCPLLHARWKRIGARAMEDVDLYGYQHVIRNLSCMCIFVEGRQAEVYGEHEADRSNRITQQCDILNRLHVQRLQGNCSCFLTE